LGKVAHGGCIEDKAGEGGARWKRWKGGMVTGWRQAARAPKRTVLRLGECIGLLASFQNHHDRIPADCQTYHC
jgi:hypothetical protein